MRSCGIIPSLRRLSEGIELDEALALVTSLGQQGLRVSAHTLYRLLQGCIIRKDLAAGRQVQYFLVKQNFNAKVRYLIPSLIQLFAAGGSLLEANQVFRMVPQPNARTWQEIISAHARNEQGKEVIGLYQEMHDSGVEPNEKIYVAVLKACGTERALTEGRFIHSHIRATQHAHSVLVGNSIIGMYINCKSLVDSWAAFNSLQSKNLFSWTTMIGGCAREGEPEQALQLFREMQQQGVSPDMVTYLTVLRACASIGALDEAKKIHVHIMKSGVAAHLVVETCLVDVYAKCSDLREARKVFNCMRKKNVVSWSVMIGGYSQHGHGQVALELFEEMQQHAVEPNKITFLSILKACSSIAAFERGKQIHAQLIAHGLQLDEAVGTSLVDMYLRCGSLGEAKAVFEDMPSKDAVLWNRMIAGFAVQGNCREAIKLYDEMQLDVRPTGMTYMTLLTACSSIAALDQGKQLHADIIKNGIQVNAAVGTGLVDMYVKCGDLASARTAFDGLQLKTVGSWTALLGGYVQHGLGQEALCLYEEMRREGFKPDVVAFVNVVKACAETAALTEGRAIHASIVESGYEGEMVLRSILVDMYAKCGSMQEAREVFETLNRDVVISNAIIQGYAQHGRGQEALLIFQQMQLEGLKPTEITFLSILKACCSIAAIADGIRIHDQVVSNGLDSNAVVGCSLVEMYAKCGGIHHAREVFDALPDRDVVLWNTMIGGYAVHGQAHESLLLLELMQQQGVKPTSVTFLSVLTACSHAGFLSQACMLFESMSEDYGISPSVEHYSCMVDVLCRAGYLSEAKDFVNSMPLTADTVLWKSLLAACRAQGDVELGRFCFDAILEIDPANAAAFVLMANIYAEAGRGKDEAKIREQMLNAGIKKESGRTWIQVDNMLHTFVAGDTDHPDKKMIYAAIKSILYTGMKLDFWNRKASVATCMVATGMVW